MQELSELEGNSNKFLVLEKQLIELKDLIDLAYNENDEDVISSCKLDLDAIFLKLESMLSNFEISSDQKIKMVKRINNSFSNLNFQIDKLIEKLEITPLL